MSKWQLLIFKNLQKFEWQKNYLISTPWKHKINFYIRLKQNSTWKHLLTFSFESSDDIFLSVSTLWIDFNAIFRKIHPSLLFQSTAKFEVFAIIQYMWWWHFGQNWWMLSVPWRTKRFRIFWSDQSWSTVVLYRNI